MTYVCWSVHHEENISLCTEINTTAICNKNGNWEPDSQDMCSVFSGNNPSGFLKLMSASNNIKLKEKSRLKH